MDGNDDVIDGMREKARAAGNLLRTMSNEHRLAIFCQLATGEKCVGELEAQIGLSQSALSQHLAKLRQSGLVATRRCRSTIYYSIVGEEPMVLLEVLHNLFCAKPKKPAPKGQSATTGGSISSSQ